MLEMAAIMSVPGAWKFSTPHRRQKSRLSSTSSNRSKLTTRSSSRLCRSVTPTNVIWVMQGPSPFMSKIMQMFMNIDKMVGRDFEAGLADLKKLTEN
jgi:hypothetical protein